MKLYNLFPIKNILNKIALIFSQKKADQSELEIEIEKLSKELNSLKIKAIEKQQKKK